MPLVSHNVDADASGITWPKRSCSSPFDHLDLTDGMVPLMTLLETCDSDISINGFPWPKELCCTSFYLSWLNKCSGAINDAIHITWWWCWCQLHHETKKSFCISFWFLTQQMELCHWWHCWHHLTLTPASWPYMTKKVTLHIVSIIIKYWIQWCYWQCHWHHMMLIPMVTVSNYWKSHVASHFNHLKLAKQQCYWWCHQCHVMPRLASHEQKGHVSSCFNPLDLNKKTVPMTMPSVPCDACTGTNSIMWPKESCHTIFSCLHLINKWCYWWCSQHHMAAWLVLMTSHDWKSHVSPHSDQCDQMNEMVPLTTPLASQGYS